MLLGDGGVEVQWVCRVQFPIVWNPSWLLVCHDMGLLIRLQADRDKTRAREDELRGKNRAITHNTMRMDLGFRNVRIDAVEGVYPSACASISTR